MFSLKVKTNKVTFAYPKNEGCVGTLILIPFHTVLSSVRSVPVKEEDCLKRRHCRVLCLSSSNSRILYGSILSP